MAFLLLLFNIYEFPSEAVGLFHYFKHFCVVPPSLYFFGPWTNSPEKERSGRMGISRPSDPVIEPQDKCNRCRFAILENAWDQAVLRGFSWMILTCSSVKSIS